MKTGGLFSGFVLIKKTPVPDCDSIALEFEHQKTGARFLHLVNSDPENLLAFAFYTPPVKSTGLTHILEHTVLSGSKKYPIRDPFAKLNQTSFASYLNAVTYPDRTIYPLCSTVEKDFFNIASAYADAVFFPLLTKDDFQTEGHHFTYDQKAGLGIQGVVYNEMKGAYSNFDRKIYNHVCADLFTNNNKFDSGGDPKEIPTLGYQEFINYHKKYYHPSNCRVVAYGNISTIKIVKFLDQIFTQFSPQPTGKSFTQQPQLSLGKLVNVDIQAISNNTHSGAFSYSFLTNPLNQETETIGMQILEEYFLGHAGSILRKALIDSKIGKDLTSSGYYYSQYDTFFSVGLKGTRPKDVNKFKNLVEAVFSKTINDGLNRDDLQAAILKTRLNYQTITNKYPINLLDRVASTWLYGLDPLYYLRVNNLLDTIENHIKDDSKYFEVLIDKYIISNKHKVLHNYIPHQHISEQEVETFKKQMEAKASKLTPSQLQKIQLNAQKLSDRQNQQDTDNHPNPLPKLLLSQIPPKNLRFDYQIVNEGPLTLLNHQIFSNQITHFQLAIDISHLSEEAIHQLPLYIEALNGMGAGGLDFASWAQKEARITSGISASVTVPTNIKDTGRFKLILNLSTSWPDKNYQPAYELFNQKLHQPDFADSNRFVDILKQNLVTRKENLSNLGHTYALREASRNFSPAANIKSFLTGVNALLLFKKYEHNSKQNINLLLETLSSIHNQVLKSPRMVAGWVGPEKLSKSILENFSQFLGSPQPQTALQTTLYPKNHIITTNTPVSYVAMAQSAPPLFHSLAASLFLAAKILQYGYLWQEIRLKGGAYGVIPVYDSASGFFGVASYRDPNTTRTLDIYKEIPQQIKKLSRLSKKTLGDNIISAISAFDTLVRPSRGASEVVWRYLTGETESFRNQYRDRLAETKPGDLDDLAEQLFIPNNTDINYAAVTSSRNITPIRCYLGDKNLEVTKI